MKNLILEALKAKFTGVSDTILIRIATNLAKTVIALEEVTTAVEGVTIQTVIESQSDFRANEATINAVANYEKKHGLTNGQKATGGELITEPTLTKGDNDTPPWAQALIDSNKALSDKVIAMEGAKVTDTRKSRLDAVIATIPDHLKKPYQRMTIDSLKDSDFDQLLDEVTAEAEIIIANDKAKGSIFQPPLGGGMSTSKPSDKDAEAVAKSIGL